MGAVANWRAWALVALGGLLWGCTGVMVSVERPGCAYERTVQVTQADGQPRQTTVKAHRTCGAPAP